MRFVALALLLVACSPPPPKRCVGGIVPPIRTPLHFEGDTVLRLPIDGPSCGLPGVLSVVPTLEDSSGATVPSSVVNLVESNVGIDVSLSVPPLRAGTYELRLFIEPAIAVVDVQVLVARREQRLPFTTTFPEPCREPARTVAGTTFCRAAQGFTAFSDAGQQSFQLATSVAATRDVVWMIEGTTAVRRLEDRGAGRLLETGVWSFGATSIPKITTCDEKTVFVDDRRFDAAPDGGLKPVASTRGQMPLLEGTSVAQLTATGWCTLADCQERLGQLVAVDDGAAWFAEKPGPVSPEFSTLSLAVRPLRKMDAGVGLLLPPGFQPLLRAFPFQVVGEAPALLFSLPDAGARTLLLLRHGPDGARGTAFPESVVLGATRDWLFTPGDTANELRAYPLSP